MKYPIIIALDPPHEIENPVEWCIKIIRETEDKVIGYKIGLPLLIRTGLEKLREIIKQMNKTDLIIADLKLADIGEIMIETIKPLLEIGIDTFIAHGFIGYRDALERLVKYLDMSKSKLILVVSMTHTGSIELIDKNIDDLIKIVLETKPWGVVVAPNKKNIIDRVKNASREENIDLKILTPGIGLQGAEPGTGLKNGADYEIIGRLITRTENPGNKLVELINKYYRWLN